MFGKGSKYVLWKLNKSTSKQMKFDSHLVPFFFASDGYCQKQSFRKNTINPITNCIGSVFVESSFVSVAAYLLFVVSLILTCLMVSFSFCTWLYTNTMRRDVFYIWFISYYLYMISVDLRAIPRRLLHPFLSYEIFLLLIHR